MDFDAAKNQIEEMAKDCEAHGGKHAGIAARRLRSAIISLNKQESVDKGEPVDDQDEGDEA